MLFKFTYIVLISLLLGRTVFGYQLKKEDIQFAQLLLSKKVKGPDVKKRIQRTNFILTGIGAGVYNRNAVNIQVDLMLLAMASKYDKSIDLKELEKKWITFFKFSRNEKVIAAERAVLQFLSKDTVAFHGFIGGYVESIPFEVNDDRVIRLRMQNCYYYAQLFLTQIAEDCYSKLYNSQILSHSIRLGARLALLNHLYVSKEFLDKIDSLIANITNDPDVSPDVKFGIKARRSIENVNDKAAMKMAKDALEQFGKDVTDPEITFRRLKAGIHLYEKDLKNAEIELQTIDERLKGVKDGISMFNTSNTELLRAFINYKNKDSSIVLKSLKLAEESVSDFTFCTSALYTRATLLAIYRLLNQSSDSNKLINRKQSEDCAQFVSQNNISTKRVTELVSLIKVLESPATIDETKIKSFHSSLSTILFPSSILLPVLEELQSRVSI